MFGVPGFSGHRWRLGLPTHCLALAYFLDIGSMSSGPDCFAVHSDRIGSVMPIRPLDLEKLGFFHVFDCVRDPSGAILFREVARTSQRLAELDVPMVYVWVSPQEGGLDVLYVGKASLGVRQRMRQHETGLRAPAAGSTGYKNRQLIDDVFSREQSLAVFARVSETATLLGVKGVSLVSAEEEAIAGLLNPTWNRAVFATARMKRQVSRKNQAPVNTSSNEGGGQPRGGRLRVGGWDFSGMRRAELLADFVESLGSQDAVRMERLIHWLLQLQVAAGAEAVIVRAYSGQPPGYSGVATLLVARLSKSGRAKRHQWVARIPLRCDARFPLTVVLPMTSSNAPECGDAITLGREACFRPNELDHFLGSPHLYTSWK